jgi:hypothetical protein
MEHKSAWSIEVNCRQILFVDFGEEVNHIEAQKRFLEDNYNDIIDEDILGYTYIHEVK